MTGIRGEFQDGELLRGTAVNVVGERCNDGLKEIIVAPVEHDPEVIWRKDPNSNKLTLPHYVGQHPTVMDPHERKSVYVHKSGIDGANEGLFARLKKLSRNNLYKRLNFYRRNFRPGDLISYFSGQKTLSKLIFHANMSEEMELEVGSYFYNLGHNCLPWWECIPNVVIEIPMEFRCHKIISIYFVIFFPQDLLTIVSS